MEKSEVDLHCHSRCSDGSDSPTAIVLRAKELGLKVISLTDHETFDGVEEFLSVAKENGLSAVSGIEFPAYYSGMEIHILAYGLDPKTKVFDDYLEVCKKVRNTHVRKQLEWVAKDQARDDISLQDLFETMKPKSKIMYFWHVCEYLKKKLNWSKGDTFFEIGYEGRLEVLSGIEKFMNHIQLVKMIKSAGGKAVLAHPGEQYNRFEGEDTMRAVWLDVLFSDLVTAGLDGVEVFNNKHEQHEKYMFSKIADAYGLHKTAGSDWHGIYTPGFDLGVPGMSALMAQFFIG